MFVKMYRAVEFLGVGKATVPIFSAHSRDEARKGAHEALLKPTAFSLIVLFASPGKRWEVDLVYPNIYIDMSYSFLCLC